MTPNLFHHAIAILVVGAITMGTVEPARAPGFLLTSSPASKAFGSEALAEAGFSVRPGRPGATLLAPVRVVLELWTSLQQRRDYRPAPPSNITVSNPGIEPGLRVVVLFDKDGVRRLSFARLEILDGDAVVGDARVFIHRRHGTRMSPGYQQIAAFTPGKGYFQRAIRLLLRSKTIDCWSSSPESSWMHDPEISEKIPAKRMYERMATPGQPGYDPWLKVTYRPDGGVDITRRSWLGIVSTRWNSVALAVLGLIGLFFLVCSGHWSLTHALFLSVLLPPPSSKQVMHAPYYIRRLRSELQKMNLPASTLAQWPDDFLWAVISHVESATLPEIHAWAPAGISLSDRDAVRLLIATERSVFNLRKNARTRGMVLEAIVAARDALGLESLFPKRITSDEQRQSKTGMDLLTAYNWRYHFFASWDDALIAAGIYPKRVSYLVGAPRPWPSQAIEVTATQETAGADLSPLASETPILDFVHRLRDQVVAHASSENPDLLVANGLYTPQAWLSGLVRELQTLVKEKLSGISFEQFQAVNRSIVFGRWLMGWSMGIFIKALPRGTDHKLLERLNINGQRLSDWITMSDPVTISAMPSLVAGFQAIIPSLPSGIYLSAAEHAELLADFELRKAFSAILEPRAIEDILIHLRLPHKPPGLAPPRIPEQFQFS